MNRSTDGTRVSPVLQDAVKICEALPEWDNSGMILCDEHEHEIGMHLRCRKGGEASLPRA
jgi:hypothetical protein